MDRSHGWRHAVCVVHEMTRADVVQYTGVVLWLWRLLYGSLPHVFQLSQSDGLYAAPWTGRLVSDGLHK